MRLPRKGAAYAQRVHFGRYVTQALRHARLFELAEAVEAATAAVKTAGRAWEDAAEPVQVALAERDAVDGDLDGAARLLRLGLASRGVAATREPPYTAVFPHGFDYFVSAPVGQQIDRYRELVERVALHLPAHDPARLEAVPRLETGIAAWAEAREGLAAARTRVSIARTTLEAAEADLDALLEKTYGELVTRVGRRKAETFFPRPARRTSPAEKAASVDA